MPITGMPVSTLSQDKHLQGRPFLTHSTLSSRSYFNTEILSERPFSNVQDRTIAAINHQKKEQARRLEFKANDGERFSSHHTLSNK